MFNLVASCVSELSAPPGNGSTAYAAANCLSPGRFFHALDRASKAEGPQLDRMLGFLLRNWLKAHELIAHVGKLDYEHARALADGSEQLATPDAASLLDSLDKGWDLLLDADLRDRLLSASAEALADPDYRGNRSPMLYWSFNQESPATNPMTIPDLARQVSPANRGDLNVTGLLKVWNIADDWVADSLYVAASGDNSASCLVYYDNEFGLEGDFSILAQMSLVGAGAEQELLRQNFGEFHVSVQRTTTPVAGGNRDDVTVKVQNTEGTTSFTFQRAPSEKLSGMYALVQQDSQLRLYGPAPTGVGMVQIGVRTFAPTPMGETYIEELRFNCSHPTLLLDDAMIFDRALDLIDLNQIASGRSQSQDSEFPLPPRTESANPAFHDGVALHIVQTANRHLDLLDHWLEEQNQGIYASCGSDQANVARAAALERAGRSVRRILDAEALADRLVADLDLDALAWGRRYRDARASASAARALVAFRTQQIRACENPLGIADSDLPMYYKFNASDTPQAAYFGSSLFLLEQAQKHIDFADQRLEAAHDAWIAQRNAEYQGKVVDADRTRPCRGWRDPPPPGPGPESKRTHRPRQPPSHRERLEPHAPRRRRRTTASMPTLMTDAV